MNRSALSAAAAATGRRGFGGTADPVEAAAFAARLAATTT